jgi:hypothetical protein
MIPFFRLLRFIVHGEDSFPQERGALCGPQARTRSQHGFVGCAVGLPSNLTWPPLAGSDRLMSLQAAVPVELGQLEFVNNISLLKPIS